MAQAFLENVSAANLTSDTIKRMYQLIDAGKTDPKFQELVYGITKGIGNKNYRGEIERIFNWAKRNVRYTRDPYGVEMVQDVWSTLKRERGDCDDFTILLGAAVETMGAPVRITTVSTRKDLEPVHVYPEAFVGGRWMPLDATVASSFPGWKPTQGITDRKVWSRSDVGIHGYDNENIEGLGMADFFKSSMLPVNLTPGVPSNISHTYADMMKGDQVIAARRQPGAPNAKVARYSDLTENPAPGNLPYNPRLPIRPFPLPENIWSYQPRPGIPMKIDPWGHMRAWKKNPNAMLPSPVVSEDKFMSNSRRANLAGVDLESTGSRDLDVLLESIQQDVAHQVAAGHVPPHAAAVVAQKTVDAAQSGDSKVLRAMPRTARIVKQIQAKQGKGAGDARTPASSPDHPVSAGMARKHLHMRDSSTNYFMEDESMDWMPALYGLGEDAKHVKHTHPKIYHHVLRQVKAKLPRFARKHGLRRANPLAGLGDALNPQEVLAAEGIASGITKAITGTVAPDDAAAINRAVDAGLQAAAAVVAPSTIQPKPITSSIMDSLKGWTTPALVVGGIMALGYFMKKGGARRYRSNPKRGGKSLMDNKLLVAGLGLGALYLFSKKPATLVPATAAPAQQSVGANLLSSLANLFKSPAAPSPTTQAAQLTTAAAGLTKAVTPLFSSSPSPVPSASATAPASSGGFVTALPGYNPNEEYQASGSNGGMITNFD